MLNGEGRGVRVQVSKNSTCGVRRSKTGPYPPDAPPVHPPVCCVGASGRARNTEVPAPTWFKWFS